MNFNACPYCKSTDITMPENRKFICGSCNKSYYHNAASAVAGIIQVGNEILLNVRKKEPAAGLYDLVGGFVDFEESMEQALTRETEEELGVTINQWRYFSSLPNTYEFDGVTYHTVDAVFFAILTTKPSITIQASEVSAALWTDINAIPFTQFGFDSLSNILRDYVQKSGALNKQLKN
jgi:NADH pyrophosphatase NudC (nudix superfamily)